MPPKYFILRQNPGCPCEVVFYDSDKQTSEIKFSGGRWAARRFLKENRGNLPAWCEKAARHGHPGACVEIPLPEVPAQQSNETKAQNG